MDRKLTIEKVWLCCMNFLTDTKNHLIAERNGLKKKEACNKQATEVMHAEEIFKHSMSNASNVSVVPSVNVEALSPTPLLLMLLLQYLLPLLLMFLLQHPFLLM